MRDRLAGFVLKLFTSGADFPRESAMSLWLRVGPADGTTFYATMKELREANPGVPTMFNHWVRLALVIAVENHWARAQEAYDYNWGLGTGAGDWMQLADHAGWAMLPGPPSATSTVREALKPVVHRKPDHTSSEGKDHD